MSTPLIRLGKGDAIIIDTVWYTEVSRRDGALKLRSIGGEIERSFTGDELRDIYFDPAGRMKIVRSELAVLEGKAAEVVARPFESFTEAQQAEMLLRLRYVQACDEFFAAKAYNKRPEDGYKKIATIVTAQLLAEFVAGTSEFDVRERKVSGSTLRDWYMRWRRAGRRLGALAPLTHRRGNYEAKLDPAVRAVIADCVRQKWLTLERPPLTVVYDLICREIEKLNKGRIGGALEAPSEMAVWRWIKDNIDQYEATFFRKGRKEADHQSRLIGKSPVAVRPLQIVEFDETPLDIQLIDQNGKERGRAHLTAGICVATGMIVGWHIGFEKPSWTTVMQALRMAVLEKDVKASGAKSPYPVYGVPEMIKVDNGPAYRSNSLVAAAGQLQFELRLVPVGKPNLKGKVERFFREVSRDFMSVFPGRTFSTIQERGDYDPEGRAKMTLEEAQLLFTRWVVDIYHNRPNSRSFCQTPLQRWEALSGCGVRLPPESADLAPLIGLVVNRTIQADGITFMGLTYRDPKLAEFRRIGHMGQEWMVKVDPLDLRALLVLDAEGKRWVSVPCQQMHLIEGLSLQMWMDVVRSAKERTKQGQRVARSTLLNAREALMLEARKMGHKPHGKITTAQYRWIEGEVNNPKYEFEIDPDVESKKSAKPRNRKAWTKDAGEPVDQDPALTDPASRAVGHGVVEKELPDADLEQAQREFFEEVADEEESERLQQFKEESARAADAARQAGEMPAVHAPESDEVPLVPEAEPVATENPGENVRPAAEPAPWLRLVTKTKHPSTGLTGADVNTRPRGLINEDDDDHWNKGGEEDGDD
jgi:putative transposase